MLPSRKFESPDAFVDAFMESLTPGIIPRADFIQWDNIDAKLQQHAASIAFFETIALKTRDGAALVPGLSTGLLNADNPKALVDCAFEFMGHTSAEFVTREDDVTLDELTASLVRRDDSAARKFAEMLRDLGFARILAQRDLKAVFLGLQLGLEPNRRKNVGGDAFADEIERVLQKVVEAIAEHGIELKLKREFTIRYGNGLSKKVDFALLQDGHTRVGLEVNFYTVAGSKPSEIKRSYGNVLEALRDEGVELLWITDGKGYRDMHRSLRDAFVIMPNIYNLQQTEKHLADDLLVWLKP